jgi:hypothetical protein
MQRSTLELKKHQPSLASQISPKKQDDAGLILPIEIIPEHRGWCQTLYFTNPVNRTCRDACNHTQTSFIFHNTLTHSHLDQFDSSRLMPNESRSPRRSTSGTAIHFGDQECGPRSRFDPLWRMQLSLSQQSPSSLSLFCQLYSVKNTPCSTATGHRLCRSASMTSIRTSR